MSANAMLDSSAVHKPSTQLQLPPPPGHKPIAWSVGAVLLGFVAQIFSALALSVAFVLVGAEAERAGEVTPTYFALVTLLGLTSLPVVWICARMMRWSVRDVGFARLRRPSTAFGVGIAVWFVFFVFSAAWAALTPSTTEEHVVLKALKEHPQIWVQIVFAVGAIVAAPIAEELVYRALLFRSLCRLGLWPAVVLSGTIFGLVHLSAAPWQNIGPLAVLGMGLAVLYHWSGSIIAPIALHGCFNALSIGVTIGSPSGDKGSESANGVLLGFSLVAAVLIACAVFWPLVRRFADRFEKTANS